MFKTPRKNNSALPQQQITLINEITQAIADASPFGSVEIYIQNDQITQITTRRIRKTKDSRITKPNNPN